MIQYILTDIEGTTTSISFVHDVLFPYASANLPAWVRSHRSEPRVKAALAEVATTVQAEQGIATEEADQIEWLLRWIKEDRKHSALKAIQGYLWKDGYESGAYRSHVYPDVPVALERWRQKGLKMGVYSSGSVPAQRLLFGFSELGDLQPYFSDYFDTAVGHKREMNSYRNIQKALGLPANAILFLSDVPEELDAAKEAGMQCLQLLRPGIAASERHVGVKTFEEIAIE
jgi:enolase-phosphatase E1